MSCSVLLPCNSPFLFELPFLFNVPLKIALFVFIEHSSALGVCSALPVPRLTITKVLFATFSGAFFKFNSVIEGNTQMNNSVFPHCVRGVALFLCLVLIPTVKNLKFSEIRYMLRFLNTCPSVGDGGIGN